MPTKTERPSGVDGLLIVGTASRGYSIHHEGTRLQVSVPIGRLSRDLVPERFTRVRDAKGAAARLAPLTDWTRENNPLGNLSHDERLAMRDQITEALAGRSLEELRELHAARVARERAHYDGTGALDSTDRLARASGHRIDWRRKGQRTFHGRCAHCGEGFRSSYQSLSDSYTHSGPVSRTCEPRGVRA